jgi:predicted ATP-binding protein involved in virulence
MKIETIKLFNFRNFGDDEFRFPTNFSVIIGENGKGKSSILQSLRLASATFLLGIDEAERYHIQKEDVRRVDLETRFVPQKNCSFEACGQLNGERLEWKRTLSKPNGRTDTKDAYPMISMAQRLNDQVNGEFRENVDLPVINFFSTARLWVGSKQTVNLKRKGSRLRDGYVRCLDERSDKKSPFEWIKSAYWKKLKDKPESVLLDAVLEAIDICIPNWTPKEWDEDSDDLGGFIKEEDDRRHFIPLYYLSDGLRTVAAMVAEIAYRCAILNPHLGRNAVKESKGIVLIDEIDMHLHPKWQKRIVHDLKTAFPNIQFIVTTHSPFIVQSLKAEELINLDAVTEQDPDRLNIQDVTSHVMKVEPRSIDFQDQYEQSEEYFKTLDRVMDSDTGQDGGGQEQLTKIEDEVEINDPAMAAFLKLNRLATLGNTNERGTDKSNR